MIKRSSKFKLIPIIAVFAALMMVFVSCNPGGQTSSGDTDGGLEVEKGKKLSILIPGHNPKSSDESVWQNPVVKDFSEKYPDITIEWVIAGWDTWETKLLANINAGDPVDVINDGANNNPKFAIKGITQPLNRYISLDNPNLHLNTMDVVFKYDGNYHVAVTETNVAVIYYNKYLFENVGVDDPMTLYQQGKWNWETFVEAAKKLTDPREKRWGLATNYPYIFFGANHTSMCKLDENFKYVLNINSEPIKQALELLQDGYYVSKWCGYDGDPWTTFYKGGAAMLGDFQSVEPQIVSAIEYGIANFEYGAAPMPAGPNNKEGVSPISAAGFALGAGSDCPVASGILIDMLVDGQAEYMRKFQEKLNPDHVALYNELAKKPYCTNSYDSAVGGAFEICQAVQAGQSITQAIEEFKPIYQRKVDEANDRSIE